jgi:cytochrome c553
MLVASTAFAADPVADKAKLCATCHGEQGIPINKTIPVIWGQNEGYIYLQLRDFKSGARKNALMNPIAAQLEKDDQLALAAYFSKQKWPNLQQPSAPNDIAAKAQSTAASVGCPGCHLDHFQGDGTTARLAGQWQEYLHAQMMGFRDGSRGNNPGMSDLMKATSPDDLAALAQYLAGLQIDAYLNQGR